MTRKEELEVLIFDMRCKIKNTMYHDVLLKLSTSLTNYLKEYESLK